MPNLTTEWLKKYERKHKAGNRLPDTVHQPVVRDGALAESKGEAQGSGRVLIRVTSLRSRLIDPDNLCAKYVVDAARYAGLITDDSAAHIDFQISQVKVPKGEEKTILEIIYP